MTSLVYSSTFCDARGRCILSQYHIHPLLGCTPSEKLVPVPLRGHWFLLHQVVLIDGRLGQKKLKKDLVDQIARTGLLEEVIQSS